MTLSIVRHAIAVPRGTPGFPNDDRPLTEEGKAKMVQAARGIALILDKPDLIVSSPLIRAYDTACIVANAYDDPVDVQQTPLLLPGSPFPPLIDLLNDVREAGHLMVVGHEPYLGELACFLLGAPTGRMPLKKGSIVCLDIESFGRRPAATLRWSLPPKVLRRIDHDRRRMRVE